MVNLFSSVNRLYVRIFGLIFHLSLPSGGHNGFSTYIYVCVGIHMYIFTCMYRCICIWVCLPDLVVKMVLSMYTYSCID